MHEASSRASSCAPTCSARSPPTSSSCTTSRSCAWATAACPASRRCCAGATPSALVAPDQFDRQAAPRAAALLGRVSSLDWLISIGLLPVSFALTGPVSAVIGANATLVGAGLVGGLVTFAALLLPGMRAVEGLSKGEIDAPGGGDGRGDGSAPAGAPVAAAA